MAKNKEWKEQKFGRLIEPNEIIIEDLPESEVIMVAKKMEKTGYFLEYWKAERQETGHLHIKNIAMPENLGVELQNKYKELIIKKYLREELWDQVDLNFYNRTEGAEPHRIVTENTEHYKGYGIKELKATFGKENKKNPFEQDIFEKAKEEHEKKPEISKDVKDWDWLINQAVNHWKEGKRQENAMCLAGYLRKNKGLGIKSVKSIISVICEKTKDKELKMRLRAIDETFMKDEDQIKGFAGLDFLNEEEQEKIDFDVYSDHDLENYKPEKMQWLINNQIPKGEIGLLAGKRGQYKTFIGLRQAISIAFGKSFLDDEVHERKKVLIIDEENGKNEIAKRVKALKKGMGINENLEIYFLSFENLKLNDPLTPRYEAFEKFVLDLKPDLILVDCLQRVVSLEVDRDNSGISAFFTGVVRGLTKRIGCTWLFIHHMRKGNPNAKAEDKLDEIRGGSELVNYCRFVLMCEEVKKKKKDEKTLLIFNVLKMSNAQIPPAKVVEFLANEDEIVMNYIGSPDEVLNTEAKIGEAIKEFILENEMTGEFKTKDILENEKEIGFKRSSLSVGLKWLLDNDELIKEKRGIWRLPSDEDL